MCGTDGVNNLIENAFNSDIILPKDIPNIDLYIDQILKIFEDRLGNTRRNENDKILTKSMVNNYSKEKMITPVKGKKYNREQVLQILMIYNLKGMLAMQDIKSITNSLINSDEEGEAEIENIFDKFNQNRKYMKDLSEVLEVQIKETYDEKISTKDLIAFLMNISYAGSCLKALAEAIIDGYFSEEEA